MDTDYVFIPLTIELELFSIIVIIVNYIMYNCYI